MFKTKRILALIPARGGSKGIKEKNIAPLCGKPLISYTIESSLGSKYIDSTVVTTDSEKIADVARQYGARVPFMRPQELATDTSKTVDAVVHAIDTLRDLGEHYDVLVLLQPTQPLRTSTDIDEAIEVFFANNSVSLVSVSPVKNHPLLIRSIRENGELQNLLNVCSTCRRQDMERFYFVNGCIYINRVDEIDSTTSFNDNKIPYIMDRDHSVDIDEMIDLSVAEVFLKENSSKCE